jgi:hypothetical protein
MREVVGSSPTATTTSFPCFLMIQILVPFESLYAERIRSSCMTRSHSPFCLSRRARPSRRCCAARDRGEEFRRRSQVLSRRQASRRFARVKTSAKLRRCFRLSHKKFLLVFLVGKRTSRGFEPGRAFWDSAVLKGWPSSDYGATSPVTASVALGWGSLSKFFHSVNCQLLDKWSNVLLNVV